MMQKEGKNRKPLVLIISLVAAIVVLGIVLGVLLSQFAGNNDKGVPEGGYLLYWNLEKGQHSKADQDGSYSFRLAYRGKPVTRKTNSADVAKEMDALDVMGLVIENGIVTGVQKVEDFTGGYACGGSKVYVASIGENVISAAKTVSGEAEFELKTDSNTVVYDVSGETSPVGGLTKLREEDYFLAILNNEDVVSHIFVVSRKDLGNTRMRYCDHCKQEVKWTMWEKITVLPAADSGHYFLNGDIQAKAQTSLQADTEIIIDLNGYTIYGKEDNRIFSLHNQGAYLAIMDYSEKQTGTLKAGESMMLIHQGACVWVRFGMFELFGGTLDASDVYCVNNGAAVCVPKDSVFNMYGGKITGATIATTYEKDTERLKGGMGGNVYVDGIFNMYGGVIEKGKAESYYFRDTNSYNNGLGGNIYVARYGTFNMTGGEIKNGSAHGGGANVFINAGATFNMSGDAKITGGATTKPGKNGGSVYVPANATFNMNGGTISGGKTTNRGGNMVIYGKFNMTAGTIENGYCVDADGNEYLADWSNIFVVNGQNINISGGHIKGHMYLMNANDNTYNVNISGTAKISGAEAGYANLFVRPGNPINVGKMEKGAEVYITATGNFSTKTAEANKKYFHVDYKGVPVSYYEKSLFAGRLGCLCGTNNGKHFGKCDGKILGWGAWTGKDYLPTTNGNYYLVNDVTLRGQMSVTNETTLALDLNGKTITGKDNQRIYSLHATEVPVNITLTDSSKNQTGKCIAVSTEPTVNEGLLFWLRKSTKPHTLTIYGGTYDASQVVNNKNGAAIHGTAYSTINIYGGTIIGGTAQSNWVDGDKPGFGGGRGGTLYTTGNFNMSGGTLTGGKAVAGTHEDAVGDAYGGNLALAGDYAVGNITGGTIEGGSAILGGNIYMGNKATLTMNGMTVKDGVAENNGGNIYMGQTTVITMEGGQIQGGKNTVAGSNGGSIYISGPATFVMKDGLVSGGQSMNMGGNFDVRGTLQIEGGEVKDGLSSNGTTSAVHSNIAVVNLGTSSNNGKLIMTGGHVYGGVNAQTEVGKVFTNIFVSGDAKITAPEGYTGLNLRNDGYVTVGGKDADGNALGGLTQGAEIWVNNDTQKLIAVSGTNAALSANDAAYFKNASLPVYFAEDSDIYLRIVNYITTAQELHDALEAGESVKLMADIIYSAADIIDENATVEHPSIINVKGSSVLDLNGFALIYIPAADPDNTDEIPAANKFINLATGNAALKVTGNGMLIHCMLDSVTDNAATFRVATGTLTIIDGVICRLYPDNGTGNAVNRWVIWDGGSGKVDIQGGIFIDDNARIVYCDSDVAITGGSFNTDPTNYGLAENYYVVKETVEGYGTMYTVMSPVEVSTPQELHDALESGKSALLIDNIDYDASKIVDANGDSAIDITNKVTLNLGGYTLNYIPDGMTDKFINITASSELIVNGEGQLIHNITSATAENGATFRVAAGQLTILGGEFRRVFAEGITKEATARGIVWDSNNGTVYISGGSFTNDSGSCVIGDGLIDGITGGTFNTDPTASVMIGYEAKLEDKVYTVNALPAGSTVKVDTALELKIAIESGFNTILAADITYDLDSNITSKMTVTLNLNGHTVTWTNNTRIDVYGGELTVTGEGGLVQNIANIFRVNGGVLNLESGSYTALDRVIWAGGSDDTAVNISGGTYKGKLHSYQGTLNINAGTFNGDLNFTGNVENVAICGGSFRTNPGMHSIADGYMVTTSTDAAGKIWYNVVVDNIVGPVEVNNAAELKVYMEAGYDVKLVANITYDLTEILTLSSGTTVELDLNGYTITHTGTDRFVNLYAGSSSSVGPSSLTIKDSSAAGTGAITSTGTGMFRVNTNATYGNAKLYVTGGTLSCRTVFWGAATEVTGGTFTEDPTTYVPAGYKVTTSTEGGKTLYTVSQGEALVTTAEQLKSDLEAGKNVKLGANIDYNLSEYITLASGTTVELDLNGYTITHTGTDRFVALLAGSSTKAPSSLTVVDSSDAGTGAITSTGTGMFRVNTNATYGNAKLYVTGGTLSCRTVFWGAATEVSGGTFTEDPTAYVPAGYKVTTSTVGGKTLYTVSQGEALVTTAEQLKSDLEAGKNVKLGANIDYNLSEYITLASGTTVELDLNGYTITHTGTDRFVALLAGSSTKAPSSLTVIDSSDAGTGAITSTGTGMFRVNTNATYGDAKLYVTGGALDCRTVFWGAATEVTGGSFTHDPTAYVPAGYEVTTSTVGSKTWYTVTEADSGITTAEALKAALEAGQSVVLGGDITFENTDAASVFINMTVDTDVTLDLNGYKLTFNVTNTNHTIQLNGSNLIIDDTSAEKDGMMEFVYGGTGGHIFRVNGADAMTVNAGTIRYVPAEGVTAGSSASRNIIHSNGTVTINGGTIVNNVGGQTVNGYAGTININGGRYNVIPANSGTCVVIPSEGYTWVIPEGENMYCLVPVVDEFTEVDTEAELREALQSAEGKVRLTANIEMNNASTVSVTGEIVLDLNGYTITVSSTKNNVHMFTLSSVSKLTITDSSAAGTGTIRALVVTNSTSSHMFRVNGTDELVLEKCKLVYDFATGVTTSNANYRNLIHSNGKVTIEDAVLDNNVLGETIRTWGSQPVTVNGGKFSKVPVFNGDYNGTYTIKAGYQLADDDNDGFYTLVPVAGV